MANAARTENGGLQSRKRAPPAVGPSLLYSPPIKSLYPVTTVYVHASRACTEEYIADDSRMHTSHHRRHSGAPTLKQLSKPRGRTP